MCRSVTNIDHGDRLLSADRVPRECDNRLPFKISRTQIDRNELFSPIDQSFSSEGGSFKRLTFVSTPSAIESSFFETIIVECQKELNDCDFIIIP
jgi:hypothetical protein